MRSAIIHTQLDNSSAPGAEAAAAAMKDMGMSEMEMNGMAMKDMATGDMPASKSNLAASISHLVSLSRFTGS